MRREGWEKSERRRNEGGKRTYVNNDIFAFVDG